MAQKKLLELYQFEECPSCQAVRVKLTDLRMSYIIHNVERERAKRDSLEKITQQRFVPVLIDPNTGVTIVDDDEKAIAYLEEHYGKNNENQ